MKGRRIAFGRRLEPKRVPQFFTVHGVAGGQYIVAQLSSELYIKPKRLTIDDPLRFPGLCLDKRLVFRLAQDHLNVNVHDRRFRSEEHTSELQSPCNLVCRLLLEKKEIYGDELAWVECMSLGCELG